MIDVVLPGGGEGSSQGGGRLHTNKKATGDSSRPVLLDKFSLFPGPEPSSSKKSGSMIRPRSLGPSRGKDKVSGRPTLWPCGPACFLLTCAREGTGGVGGSAC